MNDKCRKDELLIADHFQIAIPKQTCLIESGVLSLPNVDRGADLAGEEQDAGKLFEGEGKLVTVVKEANVGATLPPFEPFSPGTPRSTGEAQLSADHTDPCGSSRESTSPPGRARSAFKCLQTRN